MLPGLEGLLCAPLCPLWLCRSRGTSEVPSALRKAPATAVDARPGSLIHAGDGEVVWTAEKCEFGSDSVVRYYVVWTSLTWSECS